MGLMQLAFLVLSGIIAALFIASTVQTCTVRRNVKWMKECTVAESFERYGVPVVGGMDAHDVFNRIHDNRILELAAALFCVGAISFATNIMKSTPSWNFFGLIVILAFIAAVITIKSAVKVCFTASRIMRIKGWKKEDVALITLMYQCVLGKMLKDAVIALTAAFCVFMFL